MSNHWLHQLPRSASVSCNQTLQEGETVEYGSIEREFHVEASPEVVYEVISRPEHIRQWWSDDADFESAAGATGELIWGDAANPRANVVPMTVVEATPPTRFSFRWAFPAGESAGPGNSMLVIFDLSPSGSGTVVRMKETGFREMGWEAATLELQYNEHSHGWDTFLPRLGDYVLQLAASR